MSAFPPKSIRLYDLLVRRPRLRIEAADGVLAGGEVLASTVFAEPASAFAGKAVLIGAQSQLMSARALFELDGVAARLLICPPDFSGDRLTSALDQADVDIVVSDIPRDDVGARKLILFAPPRPRTEAIVGLVPSEWVLPTSGTTGAPKLVAHDLASLTGSIEPPAETPVWATFYDIRRYGGLQIFLRACVAGGALVISDGHEALSEFINRCKAAKITHISGTPSHWRRLLMSPYAAEIAPRNIRLSGEIADAAILGALRDAFPKADIVHAYASTEGGVGFEVTDGREGFPAAYLESLAGVHLKLVDGALHLRTPRAARRYVGRTDLALRDSEGYVDTGDMVERVGDRCFFRGRRSGAINVGGQKVHPEEVERVINLHDDVHMSRVFSRKSPIVGDLIAAEIVLTEAGSDRPQSEIREEILAACRRSLPRHMAPASLRIVPSLNVTTGGKLARTHA